jgi:carbamoyl-phosphate synthase large subunit
MQPERGIEALRGNARGEPVRVLVTGAGGGGTIEIIKSLRIHGYRVIAIDASEYSAGFEFANVAYVVPEAVSNDFADVVAQIIRTERPDFVVPLVDEEIPIFHTLLDSQPDPPFRVVAPSRQFCDFTLDKWKTFLRLRDASLPTPLTVLSDDCSSMRWPAVIKPRDGRGSRGLAYLAGPEDLDTYLRGTKREPAAFIVQQRVDGQEFTVSVVVGLGGPTLTVVPKEVLVKRGITLAGITRIHPAIDMLCRRIQDLLCADGPFNVQLIVDREGVPQIIEINPRYSTSVALTIASGVDEVHLVIQHALGRQTETPGFRANLMMLRHYSHKYVLENEWPPAHVRQVVSTRVE